MDSTHHINCAAENILLGTVDEAFRILKALLLGSRKLPGTCFSLVVIHQSNRGRELKSEILYRMRKLVAQFRWRFQKTPILWSD